MGRLVSLASVPRLESSEEEQEGTKRGVMMGVIREWFGSIESMCAIVALVS